LLRSDLSLWLSFLKTEALVARDNQAIDQDNIREDAGKFITIYTQTNGQMLKIAGILDAAIRRDIVRFKENSSFFRQPSLRRIDTIFPYAATPPGSRPVGHNGFLFACHRQAGRPLDSSAYKMSARAPGIIFKNCNTSYVYPTKLLNREIVSAENCSLLLREAWVEWSEGRQPRIGDLLATLRIAPAAFFGNVNWAADEFNDFQKIVHPDIFKEEFFDRRLDFFIP
jgi:hypothetical protein